MSESVSQAECLQAIGSLTNNAAGADLILMNALRVISGLDLDTAKAIYYAPDALSTKASITRNLARSKRISKPAKESLNELIKRVQEAGKPRNDLAHAFLLIQEGKPITRVLIPYVALAVRNRARTT